MEGAISHKNFVARFGGEPDLAIRRHVTFESAVFNTTVPRKYFLNPCCYGDDLARYLIERLRERGVRTAEPGQEDFGWYFSFTAGENDYDFIIGYRPADGDQTGKWIGTIERRSGLLTSILGARNREIENEAVQLIDSALLSEPIANVQWFSDEDYRRA
jgi:hypothetical protein